MPTGEPMPKALLIELLETRTFNQGFATVEYTASALVDLDLHSLPELRGSTSPTSSARTWSASRCRRRSSCAIDCRTFSTVLRRRLCGRLLLLHVVEVLDADAFAAFEETGNAFDPATAKRLRDYIYGAGNLRDPAEAYKAFRGRLPTVDALLKKRGLADVASAGDVTSCIQPDIAGAWLPLRMWLPSKMAV